MRETISDCSSMCGLTSGDIARLLEVDLKTIHNWVKQGHLKGRRTKGRHLRFRRTEVVRFMRRFAIPVPASVARVPALALFVGLPRASDEVLSRAVDPDGSSTAGLFESSIILASGEFEVLALHLDPYPLGTVIGYLEAVRRHDLTRSIAIVGVSSDRVRRQRFVECGGDVAIGNEGQLAGAVRWLTGGAQRPSNMATPPAPDHGVVRIRSVA